MGYKSDKKIRYIGLLVSLFFISINVNAQKFKENFVDSTDNALDISKWLSQVYGFVPVVGLITEPAVGYGAALAILHIHKSKELNFEGKPIPPSISAVVGAYTENGTWAGILAYKGYWKKDRIRFSAAAGYLSPNLAVYKENPLGNTSKFGFNLQGPLFVPSLSFRI